MTTIECQETGLLVASPAIFRKHSRHRQSPPSAGIGRTVSSAHQHGPARLQVNSAPQPAQVSCREAGFSNRFVMFLTASGWRF
jgi:hypothetical protein